MVFVEPFFDVAGKVVVVGESAFEAGQFGRGDDVWCADNRQ